MNQPGFNTFGATRSVKPRKPKVSDVPTPKLRPSMTLAHLGALELCAELELLGHLVIPGSVAQLCNGEYSVMFVEEDGDIVFTAHVVGVTDDE